MLTAALNNLIFSVGKGSWKSEILPVHPWVYLFITWKVLAEGSGQGTLVPFQRSSTCTDEFLLNFRIDFSTEALNR
jgi:hypothetical protein